MPVSDISGQRYGRLLVLEYVGQSQNKKAQWMCLCDCGETKVVLANNLKSGCTTSCGCFKKEVNAEALRQIATRHGHAAGGTLSSEYVSWSSMIARCKYEYVNYFHMYGGSGVTVCERWSQGNGDQSGFECFLEDMGLKPDSSYTIDRYPDGNGNYEPGNCRWASKVQQRAHQKPHKRSVKNSTIHL